MTKLLRTSGLLLGALLFAASAQAADTDSDGVDDSADNCIEAANPAQTDSDQDGFGNACDADFDNDGVVGTGDFVRLRSALGTSEGDEGYDAALDLDGNGVIDQEDAKAVQGQFGGTPGP